MEQTAYHEQPLAAETTIAQEHETEHAHGSFESDFDGGEYMATPIVWTGFLIGAAALVVAGVVGLLLAAWFYNYTTNGFS